MKIHNVLENIIQLVREYNVIKEHSDTGLKCSVNELKVYFIYT